MGKVEGTERSGIDLYVGGAEHAVLHLLYARFWHKVLYDLGLVSSSEPFYRLVNQGLILGEDGQKMSKSRGNVINPDNILEEYGADAFRLYEMFMGPLEMVKPWHTKGVEGVYRFLGRVWRLFVDSDSDREFQQNLAAGDQEPEGLLAAIRLSSAIEDLEPSAPQLKCLHTCIRKVTEDLDAMRFNTAISGLMVFVNEASQWKKLPRSILRTFLRLLEPFAPHLAEELAERLAGADGPRTIAYEPWPVFDEALLLEDVIEIPVQINGKVRARLTVARTAGKEEIEKLARELPRIEELCREKTLRQAIVLPGKLVNLVVN